MLPEITYFIRFHHSDKDETEIQNYTTAEEAWSDFRLFAEPDSFGIYRRLELFEFNWKEDQEYPLAQLTFCD